MHDPGRGGKENCDGFVFRHETHALVGNALQMTKRSEIRLMDDNGRNATGTHTYLMPSAPMRAPISAPPKALSSSAWKLIPSPFFFPSSMILSVWATS